MNGMGNTTRLPRTASTLVAAVEKDICASAHASSAILLAEWLARFLFANHCGIYSFAHIEAALAAKFDSVTFAGTRNPVLHVASELYAHGGHTRLMKNLLSGMDATSRKTAITRGAKREEIAVLLGIDSGEVAVFEQTDESEKVVALAAYFVQFERIVLHLHPDDVTAAVALAVAKKSCPQLKIYFVNHSDHTFSVAVGVADCILELSAYGWSLATERRVEWRRSFIGIPIALSGAAIGEARRSDLVLTGGSAYKFKPNGEAGLVGAFAKLLSADRTLSVVAVGPRRRDYWWWLLKLRFPQRFRTMARVPYPHYLSLLSSCALYIDSHPITGGTAFTEALMGGAKVSGRTGGPNGYGLADGLRQNGQAAFVEHCQALLRNDAIANAEQERVRNDARHFHSLEAVQRRFQMTLFENVLCAPPTALRELRFDYDFRSDWIAGGRLIAVGFRTGSQLSLLPNLLGTMLRAGASPRFIVGSIVRAAAARLRLRTWKAVP